MLYFIISTCAYIVSKGKEMLISNDSYDLNGKTIDEFENQIENDKYYFMFSKFETKYTIDEVVDYLYDIGMYRYKKDIREAIKNKEIIVFAYICALSNIDNQYEVIPYKYAGKTTTDTYEKYKNMYSTGTKYVYYYQFKRLIKYDAYGMFVPYISCDYDYRISSADISNLNDRYKLGDVVEFYDSYMQKHTGFIVYILGGTVKEPSRLYEIYDEDAHKLYYDGSQVHHDDIIQVVQSNRIDKVKDLVLNHKGGYVPFLDSYKKYIESL